MTQHMTAVDRQVEEERPERSPARQRPVLLLACAAQALVSLDMAIVNVALPSIQRDLGFDRSDLPWVVTAYGLLLGGFLILGGRLTDRFGRRRVALVGLGCFSAASLVAGLAVTPEVLVAARGLQGFGAALIVPAALSMLALAFAEGPERNRAFAVFGGVGGMSASVGVVASGLLTAGPGWRWAFLVTVPIGGALMLLTAALLVRDGARERGGRLDVAGAVTVTGGLLLVVTTLHKAANDGWFAPATLASLSGAVLLLAAFVVVESRSAAPLVPWTTFRSRSVVAGNVTAFLATSAFMSFIFVGTLLMQQELGYTPVETGLAWLATTATILPASMLGAWLATRTSISRLLLIGLGCFAFGVGWLLVIPTDSGYTTSLLLPFLCAGVGFGLCEPAIQVGALRGVPAADVGVASGLVETTREVGGAAGVAVASTVLITSYAAGTSAAYVAIGILAFVSIIAAAVGFAGRQR